MEITIYYNSKKVGKIGYSTVNDIPPAVKSALESIELAPTETGWDMQLLHGSAVDYKSNENGDHYTVKLSLENKTLTIKRNREVPMFDLEYSSVFWY